MPGRRAIFFDRDNTLIVNDGYLGDPAKVVLVDGAAAAVARARQLGFAIVVFSNQSGVARGMFDEAAVRAVDQRMAQLLLADDPAAIIDRHEFCPFHPQGMILSAAAALMLDLPASWVIGDAARDIQSGRAAGCRTILFTPTGITASPAAGERPAIEPNFQVATLAEAITVIERDTNRV
jgi:D-glycero-D-manno-heptose 1,7-bisphosphate phosphatase